MRQTAPQLPTTVPILLYTHTQLVGGVAGYVLRLAEGMHARGYRVAVMCRTGDSIEEMRHRLRAQGIPVHNVHMDDNSHAGRIRRTLDFARVVRQYRGCVLAPIMGDFGIGALVAIGGMLGGARAIVRGDLQPPMPPYYPHALFQQRMRDLLIDRTVVGAAENVVTLVEDVGLSQSKIDVVHTGIELSRFDPTHRVPSVRASLGLAADATVVGALSRLEKDVWRKGIDSFLEMAARVAPQFPTSTFVVVGDGPSRARLETQAQALGLGDRLVFAGWRSDVPDVLSEIDVFVMPSLHEGGPTTVLEAMAMARPVVATAVGMVPEVIEHGRTGLIVPPGDVDAMARAVSTLLSDEHLRAAMGAEARTVAEGGFGYETMVQGYLDSFARAYYAPRAIWRRLRG